MQYILLGMVFVMASSALEAEGITENDKRYCHYLALDKTYVDFISAHPRVGVNYELLNVSDWVLEKEQELFQSSHKVWLELVAVEYLPLSQPFNDPDCLYLH